MNPDIHHGTYVRYVAKDTTVVIGTAKQEKTYTISSLGTSDVSSKITVFFDIPVCKASTIATMDHDQMLDNNPAIRANFVSTYVQKEGQDTPYSYAYYYVTPHWKTAPTVPLSKSEIAVVGDFTFTMDLPDGVTDDNYDNYDVRVYHICKKLPFRFPQRG